MSSLNLLFLVTLLQVDPYPTLPLLSDVNLLSPREVVMSWAKQNQEA
jgi:hypothetical protein